MAVSGRLQGPPLDGDIEQYSRTNGQWVLTSGPPSAAGGGTYLANPIFGAVMDGVHDDSTAFAAAVAATPNGGTLWLPSAPVLLASNQIPNKAINIRGLGWWVNQNATTVFGSASWASSNYGTNFGGSVLIFAATTGTALTLGPATSNGTNASTIADVMLLGPGTGTGVGLLLQNMVPAHLGGNVLVANFQNGITTNNLESCSANAFKIRGCFNGLQLTNATNNCVFNGWGADTCLGAAFGVPTGGAQGTVLYAFECQGNQGIVATLSGGDGLTIGPGSYFENAGSSQGITVNGGTVYIEGIVRNTAGDSLTVSAGVVTMTASRGTAPINLTGGSLYTFGDVQATPTVTGGSWWRLLPPTGSNNNLFSSVAIPAGQYYMLNGPTDTGSVIYCDTGTGDTVVSSGSGQVRVIQNPTVPLGVATKQYVDASTGPVTQPRGTVAQVSTTANSAGTTTNVDWITAPAFTTDGTRRVRVTFTGWLSTATANSLVSMRLMEGATILQTTQLYMTVAGGSGQMSQVGLWYGVPSSGSHTYKINVLNVAGTGTVTGIANTQTPAQLLVEDIGT